MADRALFYPHTSITNPAYLFDSLLYWDTLSCIVPSPTFREPQRHRDEELRKVMDEALDRFTNKLVPSDSQKSLANDLLRPLLLDNHQIESCSPRRVTFYAMKLDALTLDALHIGGWLRGTNIPSWKIEAYIKSRKLGDTNRFPGDFSFQLPIDLGNLLMFAIASVCSSKDMPPVTTDSWEYQRSINRLLEYSGTSEKQRLAHDMNPNPDFHEGDTSVPTFAETTDSGHLRCLFAKIPQLGLTSESVNLTKALKNLIIARSKDDIQERQQIFRTTVSKYLEQLRNADPSQRGIIAEEFGRRASRDLATLNSELKRLSLSTLMIKEGLVGMGSGATAGMPDATASTIFAGLGGVAGVSRGLISHQNQRKAIEDRHWASWVMSVNSPHFRLW